MHYYNTKWYFKIVFKLLQESLIIKYNINNKFTKLNIKMVCTIARSTSSSNKRRNKETI